MKFIIGLFTLFTTLVATILAFGKTILILGIIIWLVFDPYGLGGTIGGFLAAIIKPILNLF